jgi:hypothetical protein
MPTTLTEEDQSRLESLCMLFGVGLVLFNLNKEAPEFSIRVRAQRFSPDMFYVNEFADRLKHHDAVTFEELTSQAAKQDKPEPNCSGRCVPYSVLSPVHDVFAGQIIRRTLQEEIGETK